MRDIGIALVTYNRPEHTARVILELKKYRIQPLYIFSDGPKGQSDKSAVERVREKIRGDFWGKKNPTNIIGEKNMGLAKSIVAAVDYVLERHNAVILLEDDCLPGPHFFDFMYDCLAKYEDDERVFGICGYTVPIPQKVRDDYDYDAYFFPRIGSWGWATWRSRWKHYRRDLAKAYQEAIDKDIDLSRGGKDIPSIIEGVLSGVIDAWAMGWHLATRLNHGMYVYPTVSHIENIGMDGTGKNTGRTDKWNTPIATKRSARLPDDIVLDQRILRHYEKYFGPSNPTLSLNGERGIEKRFVEERLSVGKGKVLDLGPDKLGALSMLAMERGHDVMAIGLECTKAPVEGFILGDFLEEEITDLFDTVLAISTIEHFGLAGRYGVEDDDSDADLKGMIKLRSVLKPLGRLLLTIPVGQDATLSPWHRIYGRKRLPRLLKGYTVLEEKYWAKDRHNNYLAVDKETALNTYACLGPHFYYALGQFTLMAEHPVPDEFNLTEFPTATEAKLCYCFLCDRGYLPRLLALYESMQDHCQPYSLWVLALDDVTESILTTMNLPNVTLIGMDDFVDHAILQISGRGLDEFAWTLKATWMLFVLRNAPGIQAAIYFDVDSCFYSSPEPVLKEIGRSSIAIVPHRFAPEHTKNLMCGIYNGNAIYVRNDPVGLACMRKWRHQCNDWCYRRFEEGKFCDQKYLEAWPAEFGAYSVKHKGWNLAPWNQSQYHYSPGGKEIYVEDVPVIMYHFHGLVISDEARRNFVLSPYPLAMPVEHFIYGIYTERLSEAIGEIAAIPGTQLIMPQAKQPRVRAEPQIAEIPVSRDLKAWVRAVGSRQTDGLTAEHLQTLLDLVKEHRPDTIVDIVSGCGLTLRLWLLVEDVEVVAIGDRMDEIYESWRSLPLDLSKIRWTKRAIEDIDFKAMWGQDKKVLFYFTLHNRKMAQYLLKNAVSRLPKGSIVVINDIQHGLIKELNVQQNVIKSNALVILEA